jgi:hypothetical protein
MIRSLIKLGILLVVGILVYNYFMGTEEEKAQSKEIFNEVRDLGKATWGLLKTEKAKYEEGKYEDALDKIGGLFNTLRDKAVAVKDNETLGKLAELERKRTELERKLETSKVEEYGDKQAQEKTQEELKKEIGDLIERTEALMKEMEEK